MLVRPDTASHWYLPDGTPFYEIEMVTKPGQFRPVTKRDAEKVGAWRSVTNIASCVRKFELDAWKINQALLAALTLPKKPDETVDAYCARVVQDMEEESRQAAALGSELHAAADAWITGERELTLSPKARMLFDPFPEWWESWLAENGGGPLIVDFKTQSKPREKMACYPDWGMQLVAYGVGLPWPVEGVRTELTFCNPAERYGGRVDYVADWTPMPPDALGGNGRRLVNIVLSTVEPGAIRVKEWPQDAWPGLWRSFAAARELAYGPLYERAQWEN
jgi:hypothetical protein